MLAARLVEAEPLPKSLPKSPPELSQPDISLSARWAVLQEMAEDDDDVRLQFESEFALSPEADFLDRMNAHGDAIDRELENVITSKDALQQAAEIDLDALVAEIDF